MCYDGRVTDTHLTIDIGLLNFLIRGDEVMADKGFSQILLDLTKKVHFWISIG